MYWVPTPPSVPPDDDWLIDVDPLEVIPHLPENVTGAVLDTVCSALCETVLGSDDSDIEHPATLMHVLLAKVVDKKDRDGVSHENDEDEIHNE